MSTAKSGAGIQVSDHGLLLVHSLSEARDAVKEWTETETARKGALIDYLDGAESLLSGTKRIAHYFRVDMDRLDTKKVKERYPDVYQDCLKPSAYWRLDLTP